MKVLVTGANGFLGRHVVGELLRRGYDVRGMIQPGTPPNLHIPTLQTNRVASRSKSALVFDPVKVNHPPSQEKSGEVPPPSTITDEQKLGKGNPEVVEGDLRMVESLRLAVAGCNAVVHLAALVQEWGKWEWFEEVNVNGTRRLVDAASSAGVHRFVFISSLAVHAAGDFDGGDESAIRNDGGNPYARSKIMCEDLLLEQHAAGRIETVVIRPGMVPYGEGDIRGFAPLARAIARGWLPLAAHPGRLTCTVYAPNMAQGIALALESRAAAGQVFILTDGGRPTWRDYFESIATALSQARGVPPERWSLLSSALRGKKLRYVVLPSVPLSAFARLAERVCCIFGPDCRPPLTTYLVHLMRRDTHFSCAKARAMLGYSPSFSMEQGVQAACRWWLASQRGHL